MLYMARKNKLPQHTAPTEISDAMINHTKKFPFLAEVLRKLQQGGPVAINGPGPKPDKSALHYAAELGRVDVVPS